MKYTIEQIDEYFYVFVNDILTRQLTFAYILTEYKLNSEQIYDLFVKYRQKEKERSFLYFDDKIKAEEFINVLYSLEVFKNLNVD